MKKLLFTTILFALALYCSAQTRFYTGFEGDAEKYYPKVEKEAAAYVTELQRPTWADGVSGRALDLSENAVLRQPLVIDSLETPDYSASVDLSVCVWVKTLPGAKQGTAIIGNKTDGDLKGVGWSIFTQPTGAWGAVISDGKNSYTYQPNIPRQAINNGEWHQLAFVLNREKGELWFYMDGQNVAIYNSPGIGSLENTNRTVVGGTDEYWEYGSFGQWTAFNGLLDEVEINNEWMTAEMIEADYDRFKTLERPEELIAPLRVMVWNIWHGGRRYGKHVGLERVIETIKEAQPDVVGLIETYGSGEAIADSLGYYFYLISSNLSIMSRFPIKETVKAFRPFNFGGAILDLGGNRELAVLDTWLHYLPDYCADIAKMELSSQQLIQAEGETRHAEVKSILKEIKPIYAEASKRPVIMLGDFNSGSHLDWTEATKKLHYDYTVEWPVSQEMLKAGFKDSYRELHINPLLDPGFTWTPRAATSSDRYGLRDRIDYIYYQGNLSPIESNVIDYHPMMFPSDHAAVFTVFELD